MSIVFFSYLASTLQFKLNDCNDFDDIIGVCANICEFYSNIKLAHGSRLCNLENCQVKSICDSLEDHLSNSFRRSKRLLKKNLLV